VLAALLNRASFTLFSYGETHISAVLADLSTNGHPAGEPWVAVGAQVVLYLPIL
jgi:hypothetical protein